MPDKRRHIISKLRWHTSFDMKSRAGECQSRISNWSQHDMPRELTGVFDQFALGGQSWQIDKLELDIGPVNYLDLEEELTTRIKKLLETKLAEMLHQHKVMPNTSLLKVNDELSSGLQVLQAFLLHGALPWNHDGTDQTIHGLFADLLTKNSKVLIKMLVQLAGNNKNVTRRIAWQLSEQHIISVIRTMEPANADLVTGFVKDMVIRQEKESIVHAEASGFKRNLWYWVLDYLFTSHGSLFNKKQFLKRSLQQLSAHYNIHYDELLSTIKSLVEQYGHADTTDNFVELLNSIASEEQLVQETGDSPAENDDANGRERLNNYFLHYKNALTSDAAIDFDQLVRTLSKDQPRSFADLIHSLADDPALWEHAIMYLGNDSLERIAIAQHSEMAAVILAHTRLLLSVSSPALQLTRLDIWMISMRYMARKKNVVFDKDDLLRHLIAELPLTNELLVARIPPGRKTPSTAERYNELKDAFLLHQEKERSLEQQIYKLIWELSSVNDTVNRKAAASELISYILRDPLAIIRLFEKYPGKEQLRAALHRILNYETAKKLLSQVSNDKVEIVLSLDKELCAVSGDVLVNDLIKEAAIEIIVNRDQGLTELSETILSLADDKGILAGRRANEIEKIFLSLLPPREVQNIETTGEIIALINDGKTNKGTISKLLSSFLKQTTAADLQDIINSDRDIIFDHLIPGSSQLNKEISSRYGSIELKNRLDIIFWHLLADHKAHYGKINVLESLVDKAICVAFPGSGNSTGKEDTLFALADKKLIEDLLHSLIIEKRIPAWLKVSSNKIYSTDLLNEAIIYYDQQFVSFLKKDFLSQVQFEWLAETLSIQTLVRIVSRPGPATQCSLDVVESFYHSLADKNWCDMRGRKLQFILSEIIMDTHMHNNGQVISAENTLNELLWEIVTRHGVPYKKVVDAVASDKSGLPSLFLSAFEKIKKEKIKDDRRQAVKTPAPFVYSRILYQAKDGHPAKEGIAIHNAGLVLINSYVLLLFDRLGLTTGNQFIDEMAKQQAVHYLQYIVTGKEYTAESFLPLNKVLCGIDISIPVPAEINVSSETKEIIEGLINALIGHWPAIGHTSIDGFRGNWLVRKGILTELDEKWELNVERKAYDLLLGKSPFSFSVIKFPWMKKPVHVNWPY